MRSRVTLRVAFALAAVLALAGCGSDGDVLARVGTQTIRSDDYLAAAQLLANRYPGPLDSAKVHLLRDLVDRELLVQGALRSGLHQDTLFLDYRRHVEEQMLRQRYYDQLGALDAPVSDAEVEALHGWRATESRARVVYTLSEEGIRAALAEIHRGADFAKTADRFNPAGYTPPGGDIGFIAPGMLQNPLDDAVRTAPVGQIVGPIDAVGQGWFLIRVEARRPRQQVPLERERGTLTTVLRQRKQREILVRALHRLETDYHVQLRRGAGQELVGRVLPPALQSQPPAALTLRERATTMVTYDGGVYTLGDAMDDLLGGQVQRPNFNVLSTVQRWLQMRALERTALLEALKRKLDEDPEVRRALRERLNDYLLEGYVNREVLQKAVVGEDDVRDAFRAAGLAPMRLAAARFAVVMLRDSATAAQLAASARQVGGLREAVAAATLGARVTTQTVSFPAQNEMWQALEGPFLAIGPGEYTPPVAVPGGWMVAQLASKEVAPQSFESLAPEIRGQLQQQALELKRTQRLTALSDSLKRVIPIAQYPERLRRLPWPEGPPGSIQG